MNGTQFLSPFPYPPTTTSDLFWFNIFRLSYKNLRWFYTCLIFSNGPSKVEHYKRRKTSCAISVPLGWHHPESSVSVCLQTAVCANCSFDVLDREKATSEIHDHLDYAQRCLLPSCSSPHSTLFIAIFALGASFQSPDISDWLSKAYPKLARSRGCDGLCVPWYHILSANGSKFDYRVADCIVSW